MSLVDRSRQGLRQFSHKQPEASESLDLLREVGMRICLEPFGWRPGAAAALPSSADCLNIFWIRSGCGQLDLTTRVEDVRAHQLIFLNSPGALSVRDEIQGVRVQVDWECVPDLSGGGVPKSFRQFLKWLCGNTLSIHFPKGRHAEVEWLLDRVMREDRSRPELFWTSVRLMLDEFLLLCYRQWAYKESETEKVYTSVESVVHTLRDYIDAHYREKIGLKRLSDRSGYAPSYLSSTFHKVTGQCVVEYITHKRMEHAKHLLATSGLKVVEVCLASGFNDLAHFNRMFRRIVGVTPSEFRHGPSMHQSPSVLELPPRQTAARPEPVKTGLRQFYVPVTTGRTWETTIAC